MSQPTTLILLPQTAWIGNTANVTTYTVVGTKQAAASYYMTPKDLQTVNLKLLAVTGNIFVQATLATTPAEIDWFDVYQLEANANAASNTAPKIASNASLGINIEGNFVWMRAQVRDFGSGVVQFVKLSY
jgi:hypothetical protein